MPILNKYDEVVVDPKLPWEGDIFSRKEHGRRISALISSLTKPHVISLKGDWGTGKTIFLHRLAAQLELDGTPVILVDAWKSDYLEDPILAFVAATESRLREYLKGDKSTAKALKVNSLITSLASYGSKLIVPTTKVLSAAMPGVDKMIDASAEFVQELGKTVLDWEKAQRTAESEFKTALAKTRDLLTKREPDRSVTRSIAFVIDELDRCRPDYAISTLERIKHFFDVQGVVFFIATDRANLPAAVQSVYGSTPDHAERYLRKFIDIEYTLPRPNNAAFAKALSEHYEIAQVASHIQRPDWLRAYKEAYEVPGAYERLYAVSRGAVDAYEAMNIFPRLADAWALSLRDQSQAFNLMSMCMRTAKPYNVCFPQVLAYLCCLRFHAPSLFTEFLSGDVQFGQLVNVKNDGLKRPAWIDAGDDEGADLMAFANLSAQSHDKVQGAMDEYCNNNHASGKVGAAYRRIRARVGRSANKHIPGFARDTISLSKAFANNEEDAPVL